MPARKPASAGRPKSPVVAIDGPAGAGKSTVARGVARALGLRHLDTGAMYRAIAAKTLAAGIDPGDAAGVTALARRSRIDFGPDGMRVDGRLVGKEIRAPSVTAVVSAVSAHPGVRREMVRRQRAILGEGGIVAEGRDIGTVVFPRAPVKVFLTASIGERARRRHQDLGREGGEAALEQTRQEIARRDALDSNRPVSPLVPAPDAVVLDSTGKTPHQVVAEIVALARARLDPVARDTTSTRASRPLASRTQSTEGTPGSRPRTPRSDTQDAERAARASRRREGGS